MNDKVYIVTAGSYSDYAIVRVYLAEADAVTFVNAYNATNPCDEAAVEEWAVGKPKAEYDGPVWVAQWSLQTRYDIPEPFEHVTVYEKWHTGELPPNSRVTTRESGVGGTNAYYDLHPWVVVEGLSKEHVEKSLHDTVAQVKAERAGLT
jgi:hypothetical protein